MNFALTQLTKSIRQMVASNQGIDDFIESMLKNTLQRQVRPLAHNVSPTGRFIDRQFAFHQISKGIL